MMRVAVDLQAAAERIMLENGFEVGVAAGVPQQLADLEILLLATGLAGLYRRRRG